MRAETGRRGWKASATGVAANASRDGAPRLESVGYGCNGSGLVMDGSRAGNVVVGTASWTDPTLIKCDCFYPPEAKTPEERLRFYASKFSIVEVDSSYYALPTAKNSLLWLERTPP